ncbi:threonine-phosphate decarboxylase CobD [Paenibacillus polysaccharolyticus]|uniref:threonine-phosphate decarboxylase CobD n=1 Tax=Paenibacillus polysaccharolyticus TaxID=582692 RepID=UPI00203EAC78|nr:threonine-phosphate decarboxylase CobD [Paenibacillus polysaccharolyticus]MCM3131149.1 threonine-phosphate decarboxylase CobD [Paenibacillus polysaccharolyticus]
MTGYIEVFGHGGDVETAASRFGGSAAAFLDFSANINPLGPPKEVLEALQQGLHSVLRYPDPGHRGFKALLGERLGVTQEQISVGNGAAESMALILLALAPRKVGTVEPGFSEYRALARQFGAEILHTEGFEELNWKAPAEHIEQLMEKVDLLFLGQPNNPNGVQYPVETLHRLARKAEKTGTVLVIDEAFIDFIPPALRQSLAPDLNQYPHVIIIRSMTKFYAIPGLRLGYAIGHSKYIQAMTEKQVTWSVNGLALIAGEACLRSGERFELDTISQITIERTRLIQALESYGCSVTSGEANFILVRVPEPWTAASMQEALGRRGILIRSCAMYPGLEAGHVRFAVKGAEANDRLLDVLGSVLEQSGDQDVDMASVEQGIQQGHTQHVEKIKGGKRL